LRGFEATIKAIDTPSDSFVVDVSLFGSSCSMTFALSAANQHVAPFGDQVPLQECPNQDIHAQEMLAPWPEAQVVFRTCFMESMTWTIAQIACKGSEHRLFVRAHNMTWIFREKMRWATREAPVEAGSWSCFARLVEEAGFWDLPYDAGRRILRDKTREYWKLEGYENGRYHAVIQVTEGGEASIARSCKYIRTLAEMVG
jgi:hypothetical protein